MVEKSIVAFRMDAALLAINKNLSLGCRALCHFRTYNASIAAAIIVRIAAATFAALSGR